jgi:hypothetical protein
MTEHADQIRRAFQSHEHLAPDSLVVLARAEELARTYRRRRIGAQAAGGAVLGATLIAGGLGLPGLFGGNGPRSTVVVQGPAAGGTATTPAVTTPKPSSPEYARDTAAYFAAGYELDDAEKLARIWGLSAEAKNLTNVKAEAGRRLLAGEELPVKADPENIVDLKKQKAAATFFAAGYDVADAERLSEMWRTSNVYEAKVLGGQKLLAGQELPFQP